MKQQFPFLLLAFLTMFFWEAYSQSNPIPNAGFEDWSGSTPVGWFTTNIPGFPVVTQSSNAFSGNSAMMGEVVDLGGVPFGPSATTGSIGDPTFPVSARFSRPTGQYQFSPSGNDVLGISVNLMRNSTLIGVGSIQIQDGAAAYTPFAIDINYTSQEIPDAATITISISNTSLLNIGSTFLIDDLQYDNTIGIGNEAGEHHLRFELAQNYPNPFNPTTTISYTLPVSGLTRLIVYNVRGQVVAQLIDAFQPVGQHSFIWQAKDLPSGIYYYQLTAGTHQQTRKMLLIK